MRIRWTKKNIALALCAGAVGGSIAICTVFAIRPELRVVTAQVGKAASMRITGQTLAKEDYKREGIDTYLPATYAALQSNFKFKVARACDLSNNRIHSVSGNTSRVWGAPTTFEYRAANGLPGNTRYQSPFMALLVKGFANDKHAEQFETKNFGHQIEQTEKIDPWNVDVCNTGPFESVKKLEKPSFIEITDPQAALQALVKEYNLKSPIPTLRGLSATVFEQLDPVGQPVGLHFELEANNEQAIAFFKEARAAFLSGPRAGAWSIDEFEMPNSRFKKSYFDKSPEASPHRMRKDFLTGCNMNGVKEVWVKQHEPYLCVDFIYKKSRSSALKFDRDSGAHFNVSCDTVALQ